MSTERDLVELISDKFIKNKKYKGTIKVFKKSFGFIKSELGDTYFPARGLCEGYENPHKGDEVEFEIELSQTKKGASQACNVVLIKECDINLEETSLQKNERTHKENDDNREIGVIKWFKSTKGFGLISTVEAGEFFLRKKDVLPERDLINGDIVVFTKVKDKKGKNIAKKSRLVSRSSDFSLALKYLGRNDNFIIEIDDDFLNSSTPRISEYKKNSITVEANLISSSIPRLNVLGKITLKNYKKISLIESTYMQLLKCYEHHNDKEKRQFLLNVAFWTQYTGNNQMYDNAKKYFTNIMIDESEIEDFIKKAYNKANNNVKLSFLAAGTIKEKPEVQSELLIWFIKNNPFDYSKTQQIVQSETIDDTIKILFLKIAFEKASVDYKYKILFEDCLIDISKELEATQTELLQRLSNCGLDYDKIKRVAQSDKVLAKVKVAFLLSAYEKASVDYKYKMLFEDCLIDISKESEATQTELLQRLSNCGLDYDKIKRVAQSDKVLAKVKVAFLLSAYEKASVDYKYKMLFEDCLIDISKESEATQTELLQRLSNCGLDYDKTKRVAQSDKVLATVKPAFLQSAFKKFYIDYKYKMLFEDCLIDISKESEATQTELFQSIFYGRLYYDEIKRVAQSDKVAATVKPAFLQYAFENIRPESQYRLLFEDNLVEFNLLNCIKKYDLLHIIKREKEDFYNEKFEEIYQSVSKIDRLYLWLNKLNSHYNYLEFIQVAWQLSNYERRFFNIRVKEYAKDEREQKFIQQIPTARVIDVTEDIIKYSCRWRNIYFQNGGIILFLNKEVSTQTYPWDFAREEFNLLTQEYFNNRKIDDIIVVIRKSDNSIINIQGLDNIAEKIVIEEMRKDGSTNKRIEILSNTLTKLIHNVAARNQCIKMLSTQESQFKTIDIQELVTDQYGTSRRNISFLFPIPDGLGNVFLVWESAEVEKSKATHIFRCSESIVETLKEKIKEYIEKNIYTRSKLNSYSNQSEKRELYYYTRVNHDSVDYKVWEDRMKEVMPFLKRI